MREIKITRYNQVYYFLWDNKDETIDMVNEYLKEKGKHWECSRCWDDIAKSNTSDVLAISEIYEYSNSSSYFRVGEYVLDFGDKFAGYSKDDFDKGTHIECYKNYKNID